MQISSPTLWKIMLPVAAACVLCLCLSFMSNASNSIVRAQDNSGERPKMGLQFHILQQQTIPGTFYRTKVQGGWIVAVTPLNDRQSVEMVFVPDAEHTWDGKSLK